MTQACSGDRGFEQGFYNPSHSLAITNTQQGLASLLCHGCVMGVNHFPHKCNYICRPFTIQGRLVGLVPG